MLCPFTFLQGFKKISETIFKLQKGHKYMTWIIIDNIQRVVTPKAGNSVMVLVCANCIMVLRKYFEQFSDYRVDTNILQKSLFSKFKGPSLQPKVGSLELPFLCSARCLMMLYICMKFHKNIWNGFQLTQSGHEYIVEMAFFNICCVQRATTPKVG